MSSDMTLFLLGAGASYGFDESLPEEKRIPLTDGLFHAGQQRGFLTEARYPELWAFLDAKRSLSLDVEQFLTELAEGFDAITTNARNLNSDAYREDREKN